MPLSETCTGCLSSIWKDEAAGGLVLAEPITSVLVLAAVMVAAGVGLVNFKPKRTASFFPLRRWF